MRLRSLRDMKGAEEEKVMGPLFPRLHVNDTEKGGPRAPPRNKMALYEQLSIPSQRLDLASSTLSLPPHSSSNLSPSFSPSKGCGHQRIMLSPLYISPQVPFHSAEIVKSRTPDGTNDIATRMEFKRKFMKQVSSGNLFGTESVAECSPVRPHSPSLNVSGGKIMVDVDDMDDNIDHSGILAASKRDTHMADLGKSTALDSQQLQKTPSARINSSVQFPKLNKTPSQQTDIACIKSKNSHRIHIGKIPNEVSTIEEPKETSMIGEPKEAEENLSSHTTAERSNRSKDSLVRDDTISLHLTEKSTNGDTVLCHGKGDQSGIQRLNDIAFINDGVAQLCSKALPRKGHRATDISGNCHKEDSAKKNGLLELGDLERKDDASEPLMVDTVSGLVISPDDIVGVIGSNQFWKARRAIIKYVVQKLISASPHLLLEGNPCISKCSVKPPSKSLPQCNTNPQPEEFRPKDGFRNPKQNKEQPADNIAVVSALPACEGGSKGGPHGQVPKAESNSGIPSPVLMVPDDKSRPLCFPPVGNQWLVPVMSPSEGLVYKPYTGPCPPTGGFMAPLYGRGTPLGASQAAGDFINPAFGVSASHRPPNVGILPGPSATAPLYYPTPYGLQAWNPIISTSAVEQVSNLAGSEPGSQPNGQTGQQSRRSCSTSPIPRKEAFPGHVGKFQVSKNSEFQGSTVNGPSEKAQLEERDQFSQFPTAPGVSSLNCPLQSSGRDSQTHVIKVVPHNSRSATESAARIFQSIQEGRQQHDS
ncbi:hypothetical protein BHM03_00027692 [Ensete ventricosum]|nr:hypothetical protein BHM03_00027692 [Ensete ventricosum]